MNRTRWTLLALVVVAVIAMVIVVPSWAAPTGRNINGGISYIMKPGDGSEHPAAVSFYAVELNRKGRAKGDYFFWADHQTYGFIAIQGEITCVKFFGDGVAEFSGKVVWRNSAAPNKCGDYFTVHAVDGGPAGSPDNQGAYYAAFCEATGKDAFGSQCNPCAGKPCDIGSPSELFPALTGDIVVNE